MSSGNQIDRRTFMQASARLAAERSRQASRRSWRLMLEHCRPQLVWRAKRRIPSNGIRSRGIRTRTRVGRSPSDPTAESMRRLVRRACRAAW